MSKFIISSDSCCDMTKQNLEAQQIYMKPLSFVTDQNGKLAERFDDFLGDEEAVAKFYEQVQSGMIAKTSQLNMHDLMEYFAQILKKEDKDIVHISLSSGLSGTFDQAQLAAKMLKEQFPNRTIYVVDSFSATMGQRHVVEEGVRLRNLGETAAAVAEHLREFRLHIQHWIVVDSLNHLRRGGRVSAVTAAVGTLLNIKPMLIINDEGKLAVIEKNKGMKKSFLRVAEHIKKLGDRISERKAYVVHTHAPIAAEEMKQILMKELHCQAEVVSMGPVIGAHVGPGTIAVTIYGKQRI